MTFDWRSGLQLPAPATELAGRVDLLHAIILGVTLVGFAIMAALTLFCMMRFRDGVAPANRNRKFAFSGRLEIGLAIFIGVIFVAFWVVGFRHYIQLQQPPAQTLNIYVIGKQWMWKFVYDDGVEAESTLTVPVGKPVKLTMTSRDVIHSFFVPAFRLKQDVMPNRSTTLWFEASSPGVYPVFCAEYCGLEHAGMLGQVVVLTDEAFSQWRAQAHAAPHVDLAARGAQVAVQHGCVACHTVDGRAHIGPTWRGLYGREQVLEDGSRAPADDAYIAESILDPRAKMVRGYRPVMPTYIGLLSPDEVAALVAYIKSLAEVTDG